MEKLAFVRSIGVMPLLLALVLLAPGMARAATGNPACPGEDVFFDPGNGEDIVVPTGYKVEVFAKGLNFPTAIAFRRDEKNFKVFVLESGRGLPSRCNDNELPAFGGKFSAANPLTPDILVFDNRGTKIAGPLGKPTSTGGGFQPDGPAVGLGFEDGFEGGRGGEVEEGVGLRLIRGFVSMELCGTCSFVAEPGGFMSVLRVRPETAESEVSARSASEQGEACDDGYPLVGARRPAPLAVDTAQAVACPGRG